MQVLLITSRQTKRWVIPKGNIGFNSAPHAAAAAEAEEEAGVRGTIVPRPLGTFRYRKGMRSGLCVTAKVSVFPLAVSEELDDWKEKRERERRWFTVTQAALAVEEPGLGDMIRSFGAKGSAE
jgi:8-oxo-dGTP pyrophosphatase MutT (NUDIX family)